MRSRGGRARRADPALPGRRRLRRGPQLHGRAGQPSPRRCSRTWTASAPRAFRWTSSSSRGPAVLADGSLRWAKPPVKVVDVRPVGRPRMPRRMVGPVLFLVAGGLPSGTSCSAGSARPGPPVAQAADVRSTCCRTRGFVARSVVGLATRPPGGRSVAESVRVEVGVNEGEFTHGLDRSRANEHSDTLRVPTPAPGETMSGYSCVAGPTVGGSPARAAPRGNSSGRRPVSPRPKLGPVPDRPEQGAGPAGRAIRRIVVQPAGSRWIWT